VLAVVPSVQNDPSSDLGPDTRGWRGVLLDANLKLSASLATLWIGALFALQPGVLSGGSAALTLTVLALLWLAAFWKRLPEALRVAALLVFYGGLGALGLCLAGPAAGPTIALLIGVLTGTLFFGKRGAIACLAVLALAYVVVAVAWLVGALPSRPDLLPLDPKSPRFWLRSGLAQVLGTTATVTMVAYVLGYANRTLERLKESEEKFSKAFRASPEALTISDMQTSRFLDVSRGFEQWFGWKREEVVGRPALELDMWANVEERQKMVAALREQGTVRNFRTTARKRDGGLSACMVAIEQVQIGGRACLLAVLHDVTKALQVEQALRESEEKFSKAFYVSPNAITITEIETGRFVDVNEGYTRLFGFERAEVLGRTALEVGMWQDPAERAALMKELATQGSVRDHQVHVKHRAGRLFTMLFSSDRIELGGKPHYVTVGQDITARVEAEEGLRASEERLRRLNAELEQRVADRTAQLTAANAELESFSYSVSHDLRSPLRAIDGFSKALSEDFSDQLSEEARDYLRRVSAASQRMGQLIDDLLQLSRAARVEMRREAVNLSQLAREIALVLRERQPEPVLTFECADGVEALADPALARIVLENLLHNAWKYTRKRAAPRVEFGQLSPADSPREAVFYVRDNGAGFDMRYSNKLFSPFQRLHPSTEFEGTGIGLATVRRIVSRHGGRVWAESVVGEGTIVYFSLAGVRV
jgi:PAS domain S-box-containing protein